jgi:hypothetical protein
MSENSDDKQRIGDDLIWNAGGIAKEINSSIHKVRYLVRTGKVPVSRLPGSREYFTTRRALRKVFQSPAT